MSKSIAQSEQLGRVSLEADYLFGRCIPHLDREGRMTGNPELVRSLVCPLRPEIDADRVAALLEELVAEELVVWYEARGRQCLFFPGFERHQRGIRKDREAASRFPPHTGEGVVFLNKDSGPTPEDSGPPPPKGSEVKSKSKGSEVKVSATPNWVAGFCDAWTERYQGIAPGGRIGKALKPLRAKHTDDGIMRAWKAYLAATEAQYANPERFASTFGVWETGGAAPRITAAPATIPGESTDDYIRRAQAAQQRG